MSPILAQGFRVAFLCMQAAGLKYAVTMLDKKMSQVAIEVFLSVSFMAVAVVSFQICVVTHMFMLAVHTLGLLTLIQVVDVTQDNWKVKSCSQ